MLLSGKGILVLIKSNNSGKNLRKIMCNNPNLDHVYMNEYIKFGEIMSISS